MASDSEHFSAAGAESPVLPAYGKSRRVDAERLAVVLNLVRVGAANTRQEIERLTGLGRAIVADRLSTLFDLDLLEEGELGPATGGRAPRMIRFREQAGIILVAALDQSRLGVGIANASGRLLAEHHEAADLSAGPAAVLKRLDAVFTWMNEEHRKSHDIWGIGLAAPGPVEDRLIDSSIAPQLHFLPAWDDYPIIEQLQVKYRGPVWMRSGVQMMACGEFKFGSHAGSRDLIYVKLGRRINAGIVSRGRLHHGALGSAGLIGHVIVSDRSSIRCSCGNTGCLESLAGDDAIVREGLRLVEEGLSPGLAEAFVAKGQITPVDVAVAAQSGDSACAELLAQCGELIGTALAALVNAFNPAVIALGGDIVQADNILLAAIREAVYRRSHPLVTRDLHIVRSLMGNSAGLAGSASIVSDAMFAEPALIDWISFGAPQRTPEFKAVLEQAERIMVGQKDRLGPPS